MVTQVAQTWLNSKYSDKETTDEIILHTDGVESDELVGELIIDGYKNLKTINFERKDADGNLIDGSITKVIIRNCPELKSVDFDKNKITEITFEGDFSKLRKLDVRENKLVEIDISSFPALEDLDIHRNENFAKIEGMENLTCLKKFTANNTKGVDFKGIKAWKDKIHQMLGKSLADAFPANWKTLLDDKLGGSTLNQIPPGETLKSLIQNFNDDKSQLRKELDKEKKDNTRLKAREKLLAQIIAKLSLKENATDKEVLDKIEELIKKPSTVNCSHTDYDAIKNERDNAKKEIRELKAEVERLKTENANLKNNNNDKGGKETAEHVVKQLNKWGIDIPNPKKAEMKSYSQEALNDYRDKSVINKITTLESEKEKVSYFNIGLGVLTIGSWLIVCWMLVQQTNLPETEPKLKKEKNK